MNAIQEAIAYYRLVGVIHSWDVEDLVENPAGIVLWSRRCVLLAKVVTEKELSAREISLTSVCEGEPVGVYVHLCCGDMAMAMEVLKEVNPKFLLFQRGKRNSDWHVRDFAKMYRRIGGVHGQRLV